MKHTNIVNDQYVLCPICEHKYKELNKSHLSSHGITCDEFDDQYPECTRISKISLGKKNTHKNISEHTREKLKKSHTLEGYIKKYGEIDGRLRWSNMKNNKKRSHTLEGYIEKYGEREGKNKWTSFKDDKKITLDKYIYKYGDDIGRKKYNEYIIKNKYTNTVEYYVEKYGEIEGYHRWNTKNSKNSKSSSKIITSERGEYNEYVKLVHRYTNATIKMYPEFIDNIHERSVEYHLDHKVSILSGFKNNIDAKIIGCLYNLEIIDRYSNCSKQHQSSININELLSLYMNSDLLLEYNKLEK